MKTLGIDREQSSGKVRVRLYSMPSILTAFGRVTLTFPITDKEKPLIIQDLTAALKIENDKDKAELLTDALLEMQT